MSGARSPLPRLAGRYNQLEESAVILDRHKSVPARIKQLMGERRLDCDLLSRRLSDALGVLFPLWQLEELIYDAKIIVEFDTLLRIEKILDDEYPREAKPNGHAFNGHPVAVRRPRRRLHPPEAYDAKGRRKRSRLPQSLSGD